jgi:hypothetical protein
MTVKDFCCRTTTILHDQDRHSLAAPAAPPPAALAATPVPPRARATRAKLNRYLGRRDFKIM